jgi:hypothetical protein
MDYSIIIPIYRELPHIEANLESIQDWEHLFLIDNSEDKWLKRFEGRGATIIYPDQNIGVARSWNEGIKQGKEYNFFVSSSVKFNQGFNQVIDIVEKMIEEKAPGIEYGFFTQLGWHMNCLTQKTIDIVGYFDENFYPAYEEDVDMCRRIYLAGIHANQKGETLGGVVPCAVIDAQPFEIATTLKRAGLQVNFAALRQYYIKKWGGDHEQETYTIPFNMPERDLKYFPTFTIQNLKNTYGL